MKNSENRTAINADPTVSNMTESLIVPEKFLFNLKCDGNIANCFVIVQRSTRLEYYLGASCETRIFLNKLSSETSSRKPACLSRNIRHLTRQNSSFESVELDS